MKTSAAYKIKNGARIISAYYSKSDALVLKDVPDGVEPPVQIRYLNDVVGLFFKRFVKIYGPEELSDEDREKMRKYLERIFEAKDAVTPREPKGGFYTRTP